MKWSVLAHGAVAFRGSYKDCLDHAVDQGLAEVERRYSLTGEPVDRIRLGAGVNMTLTAAEGRFLMRRAA